MRYVAWAADGADRESPMADDPWTESSCIDPDSPTPLYHQLYLLYRHRILSGVLDYGALLPGEERLAAQFGVSRITAQRSLNELAEDGLVERNRGRGTRVSYRRASRIRDNGFSGLVENLVAIIGSTTVDVLSFDYMPASPAVAALLQLTPGAMVQRAERRRCRDDVPFSFMITHLPEDIGRSFDQGDLSQKPILQLIEESGCEICAATQTISATAASPAVAKVLNIAIGAALLKIDRTVFDDTERPVQHIEVLYRPEMYQFEMSLRRVAEDGRKTWFSVEPDKQNLSETD